MKAFICQSLPIAIFTKKRIVQIGLGIENHAKIMLYLLINQLRKWHFALYRQIKLIRKYLGIMSKLEFSFFYSYFGNLWSVIGHQWICFAATAYWNSTFVKKCRISNLPQFYRLPITDYRLPIKDYTRDLNIYINSYYKLLK